MSDTVVRAVVRAVTLPVAVPLGTDPDGKPWTWESFDARMNAAFRLSTDLANWCVRRLFVLDEPTPKKPKAVAEYSGYDDAMTCVRCGLPWSENPLPRIRRKATATRPAIDKPPRPQCKCPGEPTVRYPRRGEWAKAMSSFQIVCKTVEKKYGDLRFDAVVRFDSSLLTYRYPQPFPVHNANWHAAYTPEEGKPSGAGFPTVRINIPTVGAVELRLKRRADFGRQLAMFRELHDGTAKPCEAALYRDRKGVLLLKLVGHFPRRERGEAVNVAFVHTDPNALLVVEINGRAANVTNGDHIRREIAKHKTFLRRAGEDKKREVRMDRRQRANLNKCVECRCGKQNDRLDTYVKQVAAQVAKMCERQGVGLVCYDDTNQEYMRDGFCWSCLKTRLQQLLGSKPPGEASTGEMGCGWIDGRFAHLKDFEEKQSWLRAARASWQATRKVAAHKSRRAGKSHPAVSVPPKTT